MKTVNVELTIDQDWLRSMLRYTGGEVDADWADAYVGEYRPKTEETFIALDRDDSKQLLLLLQEVYEQSVLQ